MKGRRRDAPSFRKRREALKTTHREVSGKNLVVNAACHCVRESNGWRIGLPLRIVLILLIALGSDVIAGARTPPEGSSVILMIGDGMGIGQIEAARRAAGDFGGLTMDTLEIQDGRLRTDDVRGRTTDSAAAATAMSTGRKTAAGGLGVNARGRSLMTIAELAMATGRAVGLVTTVSLTHATPAAFVVHVPDRNYFMPIAEQMVASGASVLLGGGAGHFLPRGAPSPHAASGDRRDDRNLVEEAEAAGYSVVWSAAELAHVDADSTPLLFGLFADEEMLRPLEPTLATMTWAAIEILSRDPDGFFLMVEGGLIDWVCHENDAAAAIELTLGFDSAVEVALDYTRDVGNALLIVTADHETGGMQVYRDQHHSLREDGPFAGPAGESFYVNWAPVSYTHLRAHET